MIAVIGLVLALALLVWIGTRNPSIRASDRPCNRMDQVDLNPANGLPMFDAMTDVAGNLRGTDSHSRDSWN